MSSDEKNSIGKQAPKWSIIPPGCEGSQDGADVGYLASAYGLAPDPWQQLALDAVSARDEHGNWLCSRFGLHVSRQNGKNGFLEQWELDLLAIHGMVIAHTAHEVRTARSSFLRLASFFENPEQYPELAAEVAVIRKTNGQEAIELKNGGAIRFSARSRGALRGTTADILIVDEAQELTDEQLEAILPVISAAPHGSPQMIFTGTPPNRADLGTPFKKVRIQAYEDSQKGTFNGLGWIDFGCTDEDLERIEDEALWLECNPALGLRLALDTVRDEFSTMSKYGFARERLAYWSLDVSVAGIFNAERWEDCSTSDVVDGFEKTAFAVKFSADGAFAAIAVGGIMEDGRTYIELVEQVVLNEGITDIAERIAHALQTNVSCAAVDGLHWSGSFVSELRKTVKSPAAVLQPKTNDVITACGTLVDNTLSGSIVHFKQEETDRAIRTVKKRDIGNKGGWGFGGEGCEALEAMALASWAARKTRRNPNRKQVCI